MDIGADGGAAFPSGDYHPVKGMTLRDWFAGQVLVGLITSPRDSIYTTEELAYIVADRMLKARGK